MEMMRRYFVSRKGIRLFLILARGGIAFSALIVMTLWTKVELALKL